MDALASFLSSRYESGALFVEVGVGDRRDTAAALESEGFRVVATDVRPGEDRVIDDVFDPDDSFYEGASAIYLHRPGEEMQAAALELSRRVGCDLVVRPLGSEVIGGGELFNVGGEPMYLWRKR